VANPLGCSSCRSRSRTVVSSCTAADRARWTRPPRRDRASRCCCRSGTRTAVTVGPSEFMRPRKRLSVMPHVDRWVVQTALAALGRGRCGCRRRQPVHQTVPPDARRPPRSSSSWWTASTHAGRRTASARGHGRLGIQHRAARASSAWLQHGLPVPAGRLRAGAESFPPETCSSITSRFDGISSATRSDTVNQAMVTANDQLGVRSTFRVIAEHSRT